MKVKMDDRQSRLILHGALNCALAFVIAVATARVSIAQSAKADKPASSARPMTLQTGTPVPGRPVAKAVNGRWQGKQRGRVLEFLGIPFARPPVGELRWKPAVPPAPSDRLLQATKFGYACFQPPDQGEPSSRLPQSEDCLTLNVWTRSLSRTHKAAVMVFIHGGSLSWGSSADPMYNGFHLVDGNDVVLVTMNYRLGVFGMLDLSSVGGRDYTDSRNVQVLDWIRGLQWVRQNIANFGGDPNNVTIFGQSAGGYAVAALSVSPLSRGLFNKAIPMSGAWELQKIGQRRDRVEDNTSLTAEFMKAAGVRTIDELLALPGKNVEAVQEAVNGALGGYDMPPFKPGDDDVVVPRDQARALRVGAAAGIKFMIGTTEDEMNYFTVYQPHLGVTPTRSDIAANERDIIDKYPWGEPQYKPHFEAYLTAHSADPHKYMDLFSEYLLRVESDIGAELQSDWNDVYVYIFTHDSETPDLGSPHCLDLLYVLGNLHDGLPPDQSEVDYLAGPNPPAQLARDMQAAYVSFARTGTPTIPGQPEWPRYTPDTRATMLIDHPHWTVANDPKADARKALLPIFNLDPWMSPD